MAHFTFKLPPGYENYSYAKRKRLVVKFNPKSLREIASSVVNSLPKPQALSWNSDQILPWLDAHDLTQYHQTFQQNMVDGRKLLNLTPAHLCKMNVKDYDAQKTILTAIKELFHMETHFKSRSKSLPERHPGTHFTIHNSQTGPKYQNITQTQFYQDIQILAREKLVLNHYERLHEHLKRRPNAHNVKIGRFRHELC